jgi:hypothetical protein
MGHVTATIHLCGTGTAAAATGSGGGPGLDLPLLAAIFGAFALLGAVTAGITFILARRLPPPAPAPIPVWEFPARS